MEMSTPARVLIACEDLFFRVNLEALVREAGVEAFSVSAAQDLERALDSASPAPRAAVVDLHLPKGRALELIERLHRARPELLIFAFGAHVEKELLARAEEAGAMAMPRSRFVREFPAALKKLSLGIYGAAGP